MPEMQKIQWFPGHMAKTRKKITEDLKLVDIVAEIVDARIPKSSANPILRDIIKSKPKIVLLNKSDMAAPQETSKWIEEFKRNKEIAVAIDSKNGKGIPAFYSETKNILREQIAAWEKKGMVGRPIRVMILGIPNVGKSSFINRLIKTKGRQVGKAEVQDRPGVTRQNRWFTAGNGFELLDTPGVLWPKFEDPKVGQYLAFTGAVKDEVVDIENLACSFIETLVPLYPGVIEERYKIQIPDKNIKGYEILAEIGRKRGMLISGGEINTDRAAITLLDEFRSGKLGKITLEQVK